MNVGFILICIAIFCEFAFGKAYQRNGIFMAKINLKEELSYFQYVQKVSIRMQKKSYSGDKILKYIKNLLYHHLNQDKNL